MDDVQKQSTHYTLSPEEHERIKMFVGQVNACKLEVYEINIQIEALNKKAQDAVRNTEASQRILSGAVAMLTSSQGWKEAELSQDLQVLKATVV